MTSHMATETTSARSSRHSYGYIWADWLYGSDKDQFMIDTYNECKNIDGCKDVTERAARLAILRSKVQFSNKAWVAGIIDFIDWEVRSIDTGEPFIETFGDNEDHRALGVLHAAYLHGAFRGLCRTASGEEWIGQLGEYAAAAIHQGFKYLRPAGGSDDWEMPELGEAWCKGIAFWGLACLYAAMDVAGANPDNDRALYRIHTVGCAHHIAGFWKKISW
ncbi:hypothetical protein [Nocardia brasiliensis]|uniref:hypothetical protein n=1 Tax=Nocardia brasiliensis TaxID=37326 RepID=UPI003D8AC322